MYKEPASVVASVLACVRTTGAFALGLQVSAGSVRADVT